MSKTIEIWHSKAGQYKIVSPDRDGELYVGGYTLKTDREVLMEAGCQTIDIENNEYFHIETDHGDNHATIAVENEPPEPETVEITYEAVSGNGPLVFMELTRGGDGPGNFEYTGVSIDGEEYDLVER